MSFALGRTFTLTSCSSTCHHFYLRSICFKIRELFLPVNHTPRPALRSGLGFLCFVLSEVNAEVPKVHTILNQVEVGVKNNTSISRITDSVSLLKKK